MDWSINQLFYVYSFILEELTRSLVRKMLYLYLRFQIVQQQAASSTYTYELKYQEFHCEILNGEVILWYKWLYYMKTYIFL